MGNLYEDDFGDELVKILKDKKPALVKLLESEDVSLDWDNAINISSKQGNVLIYKTNGPVKKYMGNITFRVKVNYDGFGDWEPNGIVKNSVKIKEKKRMRA